MIKFYNFVKTALLVFSGIFILNVLFINNVYSENDSQNSWFGEDPAGSITELDLTHDEPILGRIVGGQNANIADYPWQVAITTSTGSQFCGGSVINEYWIVTAAHCLGHYSNIRIRAGVTDKRSTSGQDRVVAQEIPHPQYHASTHRNDIALLKLSSPLDLSGSNVKAIPIVTAEHASEGIQDPGTLATITGWGATSEGGSAANILQVAQVPVVSNADAMNTGAYNQGQITDDMICAGYLGQGGIDACQGDSGGPFVVPAEDSPIGFRLAGATSWGIGCARPNYPGIYARVSHFQPWIEQVTNLSWEGPGASGVANPSNFTANGVSQTQINLAWQRNSSNNAVIVAWSSTGNFGTPNDGTQYSAGSSIPGGGQVIYRGTNTAYQHTGLSSASTYYYKVWSFDNNNSYSSGVTANASTQCGVITSFPYVEGFSGTSVPDCWSVVDNQGNGQVWQFGTVSSGLSGASGNYAYLNSDAYGNGNSQNADLVSPTYDFSAYNSVNLSFKHYFRQYQTSSSATLYYSTNNGNSWSQIQQWTETTSNPANFDMDLPQLAGESNVQFKWNYTGSWGYYWCIDDVEVSAEAEAQQYTLTIDVSGAGSVSPFPGTHNYSEGSTVNISASPSPGSEFDKWVINGSTYTSSSLQITMNNNINATAYFVSDDEPDCIAYELPFNENFSSGSLPDCWEITDNQGNGQVWQIGTVNNGLSGASGNYAYLDSDGYGNGNSQNSDLITPTLDLSGYSAVNLEFKHYFRQYQTSSTATLSYSTDNGATWTQIQQWNSTTSNPATFSSEIPGVAGHSEVKFKWNYTGSWGYYWCIDDVEITGGEATQQYTLTMGVDGQGSTTPAVGTHTYDEGTQVSINATPASGHEFVKWVINGSDNTNQSVNITMNSNTTATAYFEEIPTTQYTLTMGAVGQGSTTPAEGTHTYDEGTEVSISASAAEGYEFVKWVANGTDYDPGTYTVTMNQNWNIVAHFEALEEDCPAYTLPFAENFNSGTLPDCWEITDNQGNGQVWEIGSGTSFNGNGNWAYLDSDGHGSGNSQNSDLITPTLDLSSYSAVNLEFIHYFRQYQTSSTATLSYSTDNGATWTQIQQWNSTTSNPATFSSEIPGVAGHSEVKFKWNYTGSWGYYWCIDDVEITEVEASQQYTLTMGVDGQGSTTPAVGTHTYDEGTQVSINATPASGHEFVKWVINGSDNTNQSVNITMNSNITATAYFEEIPTTQYTLTMGAVGQGSTTPAVGTHTYDEGTQVTISASAAEGYEFVKWVANGTDYDPGTYNVTMNQNWNIVAHFEADDNNLNTIPYAENFSGHNIGSIPTDWELQGTSHAWSVNSSSYAGGSSPELRLNWSPAATGLSRLVINPFDVQGHSNLMMTFRMLLDNYSQNDGEVVGIDVSFNNGQSWTPLWQTTVTQDIGPEHYQLPISIPQGESTMLVAFRFDGNSYNINGWYFDDLAISIDSKSGTTNIDDSNIISDSGKPSFSIFPNPATDNISISLQGFENDAVIQLINLHGQVLNTINIDESELMQTLEINVSGFTPGLYFVNVKSNEQQLVKRLIIK